MYNDAGGHGRWSGHRPHLLFPRPLEPVHQLRSPPLGICQLGDEQRKRLGVAGDPQGPGIHRIETRIADQLAGVQPGAVLVVGGEPQAGARQGSKAGGETCRRAVREYLQV